MTLGFAGPASIVLAQDGPAGLEIAELDTRWLPWLGCWQLWEEQLDPYAPAVDDETAALVDRTSVCVRPTDTGHGVRLTATAGERVLVERVLLADGTRHEVRQADCEGWEQNEWAFDGQRLFTHAELRCGDQPARLVTGVSLMSTSSTWVDIQVVEVDTRQLIEVRRYIPMPAADQEAVLGSRDALAVDPEDIRQARRESAAPVSLVDVVDASQKTIPLVVETLLVETEPRLPLDSAALIMLDDTGINGGVIDLLVALSYPDRFVVERRDRGGSWSSGGFNGFGGFYDPVWYGSLYPYYVTPLGYYSLSRGYSPYLIGVGGAAAPFVVLAGGDVDGGGRAVRHQGYTRVRQRDAADGTGRAKPRSGTASRSGYTGGGSSGSSSGSSRGTASRGGSSGSSGGTRGGSSSGRTAVPRR